MLSYEYINFDAHHNHATHAMLALVSAHYCTASWEKRHFQPYPPNRTRLHHVGTLEPLHVM